MEPRQGTSPTANTLPTRATTAFAALVLAGLLAACSSTTEGAATNSPKIDTLEIIASGNTATVVATVSDSDGNLQSARIDWGNGFSESVTSGFPGVRAEHTYLSDGPFTISLQVTDAVGNTTNRAATTPAGVPGESTTTTAPPTTAPTTDPVPTSPPASDPATTTTTAPPSPTTTTPPSPTTTTTTTLPPEPVKIDLKSSLVFDGDASSADGAGGSAEYKQVGSSGAGFRAHAWHGYNGVGDAQVFWEFSYDATDMLDTFATDELKVAISTGASGNGVLKAPWDRTAAVEFSSLVAVGPLGSIYPEQVAIHAYLDERIGGDDSNPIVYPTFSSGFLDEFIVTRQEPGIFISFYGQCRATSGGQAFALTNEGFCDFYEAGGVQLDRANLTFAVPSS